MVFVISYYDLIEISDKTCVCELKMSGAPALLYRWTELGTDFGDGFSLPPKIRLETDFYAKNPSQIIRLAFFRLCV